MVFPWFLCKNGDFTPTTLYHISILLLIPCDESKRFLTDAPLKGSYEKNGKRPETCGNPLKISVTGTPGSRTNGASDGGKRL